MKAEVLRFLICEMEGAYGAKRGTRTRRLSISQSRSDGEPSHSIADDPSRRTRGRRGETVVDTEDERELEEDAEEEREW